MPRSDSRRRGRVTVGMNIVGIGFGTLLALVLSMGLAPGAGSRTSQEGV